MAQQRKHAITFILATLVLLSGGQLLAAPITFNTALPVASGEHLVRLQVIQNQSGDDPSGLKRDRIATTTVAAMGYGINRDWALFGILPYRKIDLDINRMGVSRDNSGWGDLTLFTRYSLYQKNERGKTFRIAPFFGVKLPTGEHNSGDKLGKFPLPVQVASGSTDYFAGVVLTYQTLKYQIDAQLSYRENNEADGLEAGDVTRLDASLQYRLWRTSGVGLPDYLYGVIEANLIHQQQDKVNGVADPDTNGTRLFIAPGIQYVTKRWIAEVAVQVPVKQNLNGSALENDYIARTSIRFNF
ncbi:MAG: hypothetical protein BMS9Abin26_1619 [Gammaproteobacteria bacterium]|nr:MAG: hypothetical protein BMS9Abin26_1619 [Gammaproteobacteria bacterium]